MATILSTKSIYFNDVCLLPKLGKVKSRKDIPNEIHRVIVSPMLAVVGETFVVEAAKLGLSITLPRFVDTIKKIKFSTLFNQNKINNNQLCFISVGLNEEKNNLEQISKNSSFNAESWLIDIANGYIPHLEASIERLKNTLKDRPQNLMVGNIITGDGLDHLIRNLTQFCQKLYVRIGIGNGSPCSTSDNTAINRGQITELMECYDCKSKYYAIDDNRYHLVSDGGIKNGGYALKAFGAGANYVLMGGYFSKALEAESNITGDGTYFGCASEKQNKLAGLDKHSEGKVNKINQEELKPLSYLVKELWGGISSGISYSGYTSLSEFIGKGTFEIKINSLPPRIRY